VVQRFELGVLLNGKHALRAERVSQDLTQKALGAAADVSPSTISDIECHRGRNVPAAKRHTTKTRTATALRLVVALGLLAEGEYTFEEFCRLQSIFPEDELYEALVNELAREQKRLARRNRRHLKLAS
jgi:transcriptional regulator with XRE-family HTH domain